MLNANIESPEDLSKKKEKVENQNPEMIKSDKELESPKVEENEEDAGKTIFLTLY